MRDVVNLAGVRPNAVQVRFGALDQPVVAKGSDFAKSLSIDHPRDSEAMVAFAMNGKQLPLLGGFPCRLIIPGWHSTYRVKALTSIEVLADLEKEYWMAKAYKLPDTPSAKPDISMAIVGSQYTIKYEYFSLDASTQRRVRKMLLTVDDG